MMRHGVRQQKLIIRNETQESELDRSWVGGGNRKSNEVGGSEAEKGEVEDREMKDSEVGESETEENEAEESDQFEGCD